MARELRTNRSGKKVENSINAFGQYVSVESKRALHSVELLNVILIVVVIVAQHLLNREWKMKRKKGNRMNEKSDKKR